MMNNDLWLVDLFPLHGLSRIEWAADVWTLLFWKGFQEVRDEQVVSHSNKAPEFWPLCDLWPLGEGLTPQCDLWPLGEGLTSQCDLWPQCDLWATLCCVNPWGQMISETLPVGFLHLIFDCIYFCQGLIPSKHHEPEHVWSIKHIETHLKSQLA